MVINAILTYLGVAAAFVSQDTPQTAKRLLPSDEHAHETATTASTIVSSGDNLAFKHAADDRLSKTIRVDPMYPQSATVRIKTVASFILSNPHHVRLVSAWSRSALPFILRFDDGRCFLFGAENTGYLPIGGFRPIKCNPPAREKQASRSPHSEKSLRYIGASWGFEAWGNRHDNITIVTNPLITGFQSLFQIKMNALAIGAISSPDSNDASMTLVGYYKKRIVLILLDVHY